MTEPGSPLRAVDTGESRRPGASDTTADAGGPELLRLFHAVWQSRWLVAACVGVALLIGTAYNYTARPRYEAVAQIQITRTAPTLVPGAPVLETVSPEWIETQYRILVGKTLLTKVVERHHFESHGELRMGPLRSPLEVVKTRLGIGPPDESAALALAPAVAAFRSRITVRPVPRTNLVDLVFKAYDPVFAAGAANALAQTYIDESRSERVDQSAETARLIGDRLQAEQQEAKNTLEALRVFEQQSGTGNIEALQRAAEARLSEASGRLIATRAETASRKAYLDQLRRMSPDEIATLPELSGNASLQGLRRQMIDLQSRKADLDQSLGPRHPDVLAIVTRLRGIEEQITAEGAGARRAAEAAYEVAMRQEATVQATVDSAQREIASLREKAPQYESLKREAEASNEVAEALARRGKQASVEGAVTDRRVRLVEPAEVPARPAFPDRTGNLEVALVIGLGMGIGLVVAREKLDGGIRTPDDVRAALGVPFLGLVPEIGSAAGSSGRGPLSALKLPASELSEAYRVIRTNVMAVAGSRRTLLVTSIHPSEGKSTTALNLAAALAQTGQTAILVDADLRRPTVHANLGVPRVPGLREAIERGLAFREVVRESAVAALASIPAGTTPENPAELLGSEEMRRLLRNLPSAYDWVIVDAPPVGGMADALVLAGLCDGVILVIEGERTTRSVAADGVGQLAAVGGVTIGAILNRVDVRRNSYYLSRYASGYHSRYQTGPYAIGQKKRLGTPRSTAAIRK